MKSENIDNILENQNLKKEFVIRNLDLYQVFFPIPDDIERENYCLLHLLDWVDKYREFNGNRKAMEKDGYLYPPIEPDISPEDDWYRFELWLKGEPVRKKLREILKPYYEPPAPKTLDDNEIVAALDRFVEALDDVSIIAAFMDNKDLPHRLSYTYLWECLEDEYELFNEGFYHIDGCSGSCPWCFQRPWCDLGTTSCWKEDEQAGVMYLPEIVKPYVSASPVSLQILQEHQAKEDREME